MTTQNTQFEHSDVDADAVEHPVDSVTQVDPSTAIDSPIDVAAQAEPSSPDLTAPDVAENATDAQGEPSNDAPEASATPDSAQEATNEPQPQEGAEPTPLFEAEQVAPEFSLTVEEIYSAPISSEVVPLVAQEEEIQPFTAFIEEFRQSEFRRGSGMQTTEEPFAPFMPAGEHVVTDGAQLDFAGSATGNAAEIVPETQEAQEAQETQAVSAQEETVIKGEEVNAVQAPSTPPQPPAERPVSPLLRPATRLRVPRHAATRHREEPAPVAEAADAPVAPAPQTESSPEAARPARRYRFDRPAARNGAATPPASVSTPSGSLLPPAVPPRQEEPKEKENGGRGATAAVRTENGHGSETQGKPPVAEVQEPTAAEIVPVPPVAQPEHGRRRHSQNQERQREKEQQNAAAAAAAAASIVPAAEVVVPALQVVETPSPEEIAPEDLPPLEYAELQKASTRRRRRHRSSPGAVAPVATVAVPPVLARPVSPPVVTEVPVAPAPAAQVPAPAPAARIPNTPAAANNQFTIVSGYTVNQMNQGNEMSGPFLGPEPSPARGSLLSRDSRSVRAEVQRTPTYTTRSTENTHSAASVNQLANVVAQAIQSQTDRMVAELRRANQAPTNVSVTLPPFPSTERVGVFVDVANLLYSARTLRIAVDFGKLLDFLRGNRRLVRAHAYCPTSPQPGDEQMFLQAVKGLGYRITTKNYKTFSSGAKKADLDLDLCMDVVRLVDGRAVDCIVLVSGDSDFMPMLDYCSERGVRVEVAAFDEAMSQTLRQSCDLFINLSMLEEIRS